jgi:hypothetical protein
MYRQDVHDLAKRRAARMTMAIICPAAREHDVVHGTLRKDLRPPNTALGDAWSVTWHSQGEFVSLAGGAQSCSTPAWRDLDAEPRPAQRTHDNDNEPAVPTLLFCIFSVVPPCELSCSHLPWS